MKFSINFGGHLLPKAALLFLALTACLFLPVLPLAAQSYTVTATDGTDLNTDIGLINVGGSPASINFNVTGNSINLNGLSLTTLTADVTFGSSNSLTITDLTTAVGLNSNALIELGQSFQFNLSGSGNLGIDGGGNGLAGNSAALNAGSINVDTSAGLNVQGGEGTNGTVGVGGNGGDATLLSAGAVSVVDGGLTVTGGTGGSNSTTTPGLNGLGGSASVSIGSLAMSGSFATIGGGNGGVAYNAGSGNDGGAAALSIAGPVSAVSSDLYVVGGVGGTSWDIDNASNGGNGGSATLTSTGPVSFSTGFLEVAGGNGGDSSAGNGGDGGNGIISTTAAVTVDSSGISVIGGTGGYSYGYETNEGVGGSALVTVGSLNLTSNNFNSVSPSGQQSELSLQGGTVDTEVDWSANDAEAGGSANLTATGAVSVDSSLVNVDGAAGGISSAGAGGAGGSASVSIGTSVTLTGTYASSQLNLVGGAGGTGDTSTDYSATGTGGSGGAATLSVAEAVLVDSSQINVDGGVGGDSYVYEGGAGGSASVSVGTSLSLTNTLSSSQLNLVGGAGGAGDTFPYGGEVGMGGAGGAATLSVGGAVSVDSSSISVVGGAGGSGYGTSGAEGAGGNASVSIGSTLAVNDGSNVTVGGGTGGSDDVYGSSSYGGNGGSAALSVVGGVSITNGSLIEVAAGSGNSTKTGPGGGIGANGSITLGGGLTVVSSGLAVSGGAGGDNLDYSGGDDVGLGGIGGSAALTVAGAVSMNNSGLTVTGGAAGSGFGAASTSEGAGGNASVSLEDGLVVNGGSYINATGGAGGLDGGNGSYTGSANGGNGGSVTLSVTGGVSIGSSSVSLLGSTGGNSYAETGGIGGNATWLSDAATLNGAATVYLLGGSGGTGGTVGGNGGNASVSLGTLNMIDAASAVTVLGGAGAAGGSAGNANVTIGTLFGAGTLDIYSTGTSTLQVSSGNFSGAIQGNESLNVAGGGALTLSGANSYSGGTTVSGAGSTLNIQNDGNIANNGLVLDGGTLQAGGSGLTLSENVTLTSNGGTVDSNGVDSLISSTISGSGGLAVTSSSAGGALTLTGTNIYTGGTTVTGGMLVAANDNALGTSALAVNGGTLMVSGPRTLSIGGYYTQGPSGTLELGLGGTTSGLFDLLDIAGTANLAGTLKLIPYNNFLLHDNETFTILTASSVSGTFSTVSNGLLGGGISVVYNPTDVVLDVTANAPTFASLGTTTNQKNVGAALDSLTAHLNNSSLIYTLGSLSNSALPAVYDMISPASLTPFYQMGFDIAQQEAGLVGSRLSEMFGGSLSNNMAWNGQSPMFAANMPAAQEASMSSDLKPERWGGFINGLGSFATVTGDGNGPGYQFAIGGVAAGMDYRFSKNFAGGLLFGYSSSGTSQSVGSVNASGGQAGVYAGWKQDAFHVDALAEAGLNSYTTQRTALGGTAAGNTGGQQYSGQLNVGYDLKMDQAKITPFVSGQFTNVSLNSFTETGSVAPLTFGAQNESCFNGDLGATGSLKMDMGGDFALSPMVSAAWEHVFQGNVDSLTASFANGGSFTVNGPNTGTDGAVLGVGVDALCGKDLNIFAQYQGKVGLTNYSENNLSAGVNVGF